MSGGSLAAMISDFLSAFRITLFLLVLRLTFTFTSKIYHASVKKSRRKRDFFLFFLFFELENVNARRYCKERR